MVADRFVIEKKIGKGSFGEVYKGYDIETREPVAIKIVSIYSFLYCLTKLLKAINTNCI